MESAASTLAAIQKDLDKTNEKIEDRQKEIDKYKEKIADLMKEIKSLQSDQQKATSKKAEAEKKVNETTSAVKAIEATIQQHRSILQ